MISRLVLACLLVTSLAACKKGGGDGIDKCAVSVGTCNQGSTACGIQLACDNKQLELKCAMPGVGAMTIEWQCAENGVLAVK